MERSGLGALERRLGEFLTNERLPAHLHKHATAAVQLAAAIEEHVGQREAAARADQRRLQEAYIAEQPKIAQITAQADKLPGIFARYQAQADLDLRSSFRQAVADMRQDLPGYLESVELPSAAGLTKVVQNKKMAAEAAAAIGVHHRPARQVEPDRGPCAARAHHGAARRRGEGRSSGHRRTA